MFDATCLEVLMELVAEIDQLDQWCSPAQNLTPFTFLLGMKINNMLPPLPNQPTTSPPHRIHTHLLK